MLDLDDLAAFVRIADLGSISGAARALGLPKSSVSRSLVRLEGDIGAVLVERSTRHLRLTDAGLLMRRHAGRILDDVAEAECGVGGLLKEPTGDLRVHVPFTFAAGPLASMLPAFTAEYPRVRVVLTVENRLADLQMESVDVAIRIGPLKDSDLIARRLTSFELWPCASPDYLRGRPAIARPEDLHGHALIAHADLPESWIFRGAAGEVRDVTLGRRTVVPEPSVLKSMLAAGAGIGLLPDFHAADAVRLGILVRLLPEFEGRRVDAHALYPSHRGLSAKARVFIDALVDHLSGPSSSSAERSRPGARTRTPRSRAGSL